MDHLHVEYHSKINTDAMDPAMGGGGGIEKVTGLGGRGGLHVTLKTKQTNKQFFTYFLFFFIGERSTILSSFL